MAQQEQVPRFRAEDLLALAADLLEKAGLPGERAAIVARTLLEADLMGHSTHGLYLLPLYIDSIGDGMMTLEGEPTVLSDRGAALAWDGRYLPGAWLTHRAIDIALERIVEHPVVTVTIQKSHHIGSLASYPERATERGLIMLLSCSDPNSELVAPYGAVDAVYSPNPLAAGIPTSGRPIIFDTSMSTTAWGVVNRAKASGKPLPSPWLLDANGSATDDPHSIDADPPSTLLPIGGLDHGYKGFALGLLVEALACGLSGSGRADKPGRWSSATFLQIIDPAAFGGTDAFKREMDFLAARCHEAKPRPGVDSVRLPGERALALRDEQRRDGVRLYPGIAEALNDRARRFGLRPINEF